MARLFKSRDQWIHLGNGHVVRINRSGGRHFAMIDLRPTSDGPPKRFPRTRKQRQAQRRRAKPHGPVTVHAHVPLNKTQTHDLFCMLAEAVGWDTGDARPLGIETREGVKVYVWEETEDRPAMIRVHYGKPPAFAWIFAELPRRPLIGGVRELADVLGWELG